MVHTSAPSLYMAAMLTALCLCPALQASPTPPSINWHTNYEAAISSAKESCKPLLLFVTGSDWCGWCMKLEQEVLETEEFYNQAADRFVFMKVDFPLYKTIAKEIVAQNKALQSRYHIHNFPTIILLDSNQQQIGQTGYQPCSAKCYAQHLIGMVEEYSDYRAKIKQLGHLELSSEDLKKLYHIAQQLDLQHEVCSILKEGMESKQREFFALERYRFLAEEGQIHSKEAAQLRRFLLEQDPDNHKQTHYNVAIIEFETFLAEMEKENYAAELAVAPLVSYIEKFGGKDAENVWRLHLIISQVFLDKDKLDKALYYAQSSLNAAPVAVKIQIARAIENISSRMAAAHP